MWQIIKHYLFYRGGIPVILLAIAVMFVFDFIVFEEVGVITSISVVLMFPYLDMFAKPFGANKDYTGLGLRLPLGFNKIWAAKIISFYVLSALVIAIHLLMISYFEIDFWKETERAVRGYMIMYLIFFLMGKWMLFKPGSYKYLTVIFGVLLFFTVYLWNFKWLMDTLMQQTGFGREHPVILLSFLIPILVITLSDYLIAYFNKNNMVKI